MGNYHILDSTGHFPGQNYYTGVLIGKATQHATKNGRYFASDSQQTLVNNRESNAKVQFEEDQVGLRKEGFKLREPGHGHTPCKEDKIGRTYRKQALDGTMEFERIHSRALCSHIDLPNDTEQLQSIGIWAPCVAGNIDRDKVPIDLTIPLYVPRYLGHHHTQIITQLRPTEKCFPGFIAQNCWNSQTYQGSSSTDLKKPCMGKDGRGCKCPDKTKGTNSPLYREISLDKKACFNKGDLPLEYWPNIVPKPQLSDYVQMQTKINQPTTMKVAVSMPTWKSSMDNALKIYNIDHAKSGFAGFFPVRSNILGLSMNRAILGLKLQPPKS